MQVARCFCLSTKSRGMKRPLSQTIGELLANKCTPTIIFEARRNKSQIETQQKQDCTFL